MSETLNLALKRELAAFETLTPAVARFLAEHEASAETSYTVNLVLEEIILNLIRHASGAESDSIQLELALEPECVRIVIEDDSQPFDPRAAPELKRDAPLAEWSTGGMGLHLVRGLVDRLDYARQDGKNRLEVRIAVRPR